MSRQKEDGVRNHKPESFQAGAGDRGLDSFGWKGWITTKPPPISVKGLQMLQVPSMVHLGHRNPWGSARVLQGSVSHGWIFVYGWFFGLCSCMALCFDLSVPNCLIIECGLYLRIITNKACSSILRYMHHEQQQRKQSAWDAIKMKSNPGASATPTTEGAGRARHFQCDTHNCGGVWKGLLLEDFCCPLQATHRPPL